MSIIKTAPMNAVTVRSNAPAAEPAHIESREAVAPKIKVGRLIGRPSSGKIVVSIRLEPAVVDRWKATGPGWQARINEALKTATISSTSST